ncbi:amino acid ABC transporter substrate-binding protein [Rhizobium puerariae]|uniref:Amino acid ABC transporter substrate-binding protein n=1 Tax=Rhizobium puerariae TaxID=1585791 RepID=A0ABV6AEF4_9HYPH
MRKKLLTSLLACAAFSVANQASAGPTLDKIKARGELVCGVNTGLGGFSVADSSGRWTGFDVDMCKAIAASIFGDASKVRFVPTSEQVRFTALQAGEVDVLTRNSTWTLQRDAGLGLDWAGINFYDGLAFMVPVASGIKDLKALDGATICMNQGSAAEVDTRNYFTTNGMTYQPLAIENQESLNNSFFSGRCDAITADSSNLAAIRATAKKPADYVVLPEIISKSPLGPVVRKDDPQFTAIVRWTLNAMITAEEYGVTSANVEEMKSSGSEAVKSLLGATPGSGNALGISENWAYNIIKQIGNYGESFERHVGAGSPLGLPRGANALWSKGGLLYAPPM